jgi:antitoxin component of MazEF toxin-antitoxin module
MIDNPNIRTSIRKVGGSLYLRIPVWLVQLRNLHIGDDVVWMPEDVSTDFAVRLQFEKADAEPVSAVCDTTELPVAS